MVLLLRPWMRHEGYVSMSVLEKAAEVTQEEGLLMRKTSHNQKETAAAIM